MAKRMSDEQISARLKELTGWSVVDGMLHRELRFGDFIGAFSFMSAVALVSESMNHHPQWTNVYNRVSIDLSTHDAGGISELDFELAARIDVLAERWAV